MGEGLSFFRFLLSNRFARCSNEPMIDIDLGNFPHRSRSRLKTQSLKISRMKSQRHWTWLTFLFVMASTMGDSRRGCFPSYARESFNFEIQTLPLNSPPDAAADLQGESMPWSVCLPARASRAALDSLSIEALAASQASLTGVSGNVEAAFPKSEMGLSVDRLSSCRKTSDPLRAGQVRLVGGDCFSSLFSKPLSEES